jgi:hypothetical protein
MLRLTICGPRNPSDEFPRSIEVKWNSFLATKYLRRFARSTSDEIPLSSCCGEAEFYQAVEYYDQC